MPTTFNEAVAARVEGTGERSALRAVQAWPYLIGKAANRQTLLYRELQDIMEYPNANPLASVLNNILRYCEQHGLPPLTILVVNQQGVPGGGFRLQDAEPHYAQQEAVFNHPWFKLIPPTLEDFQNAAEWFKAQTK